MTELFIGEIQPTGAGFARRGTAECNGQLLPIAQNQTLYALLGTAFGGDGRTTMGIPDLRGRVPVGVNSFYPLGKRSGYETITLNLSHLPSHNHVMMAASDVGNKGRAGATHYLATSNGGNAYSAGPANVELDTRAIGSYGGSIAHENMQPTMVVNFTIALTGIFPSRN